MKTLNIILFLITGIMTYAQPTVTRTGVDRINIPTTFRAEDVTTASVSAGPSGANVTWDFSAYTGSNVVTTTTNACPGEANCFRFPGANRITKPVSIDSYNFNSVSDTEAVLLGSYSGPGLGSVTETYTDPLIDYKFPITYLQQFNDTYQSNTVSGIGNTNETGQVDYSVDGYGTIITPAGTFTNVLRIKRLRTSTQTVTGIPTPISLTNESYQWISQNEGLVFSFSINTFIFNGTNITKAISYLDTSVLSTVDSGHKKAEFSVYPNPSSDFITITSKEELKKAVVTSLNGKTVLTNGTSDSIDLSKLPKGVYILQGEFKNGSVSSKKIIRK